MYSDVNSDANSVTVSISQYQLEILKNKLNSFTVSIFLQFIGEDSHLVQQLYLDYKIGMVNKLVCLMILITSIPLWLLRTPFVGSNTLFSLAWLFYILGVGIPVIILLLKIPDDSKYVVDLSRDPNNISTNNILIQRIQLIISTCAPLASGFLLLARSLSGECSFDKIQLINSNKCNPEHNSFAIPQEQVFIVGMLPILISIIFKTPIYCTLISLMECTIFIAVSTLYTKNYNSVWTLIIAVSLPSIILYEYEREQLNIFLSLLRGCSEFHHVKLTSSDDGKGRDKKSTNNRENVKEGPFLEMVKVATDKMLESFRSELSKEFAYNQENFQNLETLTINSLGSAAFSERRRHYINDNMDDNDNYSDCSEALESKSVESTVESVSERNAAIIPEPTSPTQEDATYRAAYMRSLAVGKIMDFVSADGQFSKFNSDEGNEGKTKIDRLLITHRNLVVELENIKTATPGGIESFWRRIDDFLLELDKYRTQNEVERQLLDYMTRSANNFRNRK